MGERSLVCLSRALLRKSPIVLIDEATANIDHESDALVQEALQTEFVDSTLLVVVSRLGFIGLLWLTN